jgi:hypothetical protein
MKDDEREFEQRARTALDRSITGIDAATRARLANMRAAALEQKLLLRWLPLDLTVPLTAFAAAILVVVAISIGTGSGQYPEQLALQDTDMAMELLLNDGAQDDLADPDFYIWLDVVLLEEEEAVNAS